MESNEAEMEVYYACKNYLFNSINELNKTRIKCCHRSERHAVEYCFSNNKNMLLFCDFLNHQILSTDLATRWLCSYFVTLFL